MAEGEWCAHNETVATRINSASNTPQIFCLTLILPLETEGSLSYRPVVPELADASLPQPGSGGSSGNTGQRQNALSTRGAGPPSAGSPALSKMSSAPLKITVLGSGTSMGVPTLGCPCRVCRSTDPRDKRLRPSVLIQFGGYNVVVDTSPDFRAQVLRLNLEKLDAIVFSASTTFGRTTSASARPCRSTATKTPFRSSGVFSPMFSTTSRR